MSAIETYLQYIASKVWARDVRTAIVNAIRQCYDDVHNPTLNTEALQAAIQAKIDAGQMAALTIGDRTITAAKLALGVIPTPDTTLSQSGVPADAKETGDEITAINKYLNDVKDDLNKLENDLGGEVQEEIDFIYNYYINIRDNTVIPINNPVADARYKYAIVNCKEGDAFLINAYGGSAPRAYCFIDSSNTKLLASGADENILNTKITAPANSAKIIIQDRYYDQDRYDFGDLPSYKISTTKGAIGDIFVRFDKTQNKTDSEKATARENIGLDELPDGLSDDVKQTLLACFTHVVWVDEHGPDYYTALEEALYRDKLNYGVYVPKKTINGQYIDEYGEIRNGIVGESFYIDDYIPVVRHNYWIGMKPASLRIPAPGTTPTNESNWCVSEYDNTKNFIKQTHFGSSYELCTSTLYAFDATTKYMRIGWDDPNLSTNAKAFDIENPSEITVLPVEVGNIDVSTGANSVSTTRVRTAGYIPVSDTITVTGCPFYDSWSGWLSLWTSAGYSQDSFFYAIRCYDSSKGYLGGLTYEGTNAFREDISNIPLFEGTSYIRFIFQTNDYAALSITLSNHLITINGTKYYLAKNA